MFLSFSSLSDVSLALDLDGLAGTFSSNQKEKRAVEFSLFGSFQIWSGFFFFLSYYRACGIDFVFCPGGSLLSNKEKKRERLGDGIRGQYEYALLVLSFCRSIAFERNN